MPSPTEPQPEAAPLPVGLILRISDNQDGQSRSIERQEKEGRAYADMRGWKVVKTYADDGISGWQIGVERPGYEEALKDLQEGTEIRGLACYHVDRVTRRISQFGRLVKIYEEDPTLVFGSVHGGIDLSSPLMRGLAMFFVGMAEEESRNTSRRVTSYKFHEAIAGRARSNYPAFGWNADGTLNGKAELRRQAIIAVAEGVLSPTAIAENWRNQGVMTERGKTWRQSAVRRVILAPRNAGFAVYREEIMLDKGGRPVMGDWTPLVDEGTWREACAVIEGKTKRSPHRTKSLLSTIARCGKCGSGMVRIKRGEGRFYYACRSKDSGGCAGVSINGNRLDEQIIDLARAYLKDEHVEVKPEPFQGKARLDEVAAKVAELMGQYRSGELSGGIVFPSIKELEDEQRELQAAKTQHDGYVRRITSVEGAWPEDDVDKQKAVLRQLFIGIVIKPSGRTGFYNEDRVDPVWA